jgi:hypothetical protein
VKIKGCDDVVRLFAERGVDTVLVLSGVGVKCLLESTVLSPDVDSVCSRHERPVACHPAARDDAVYDSP